MKNSWDFIHICDLQPGSSRSFRFDPRMMENWQTALTQLSELNADLLLVGGDLTRDGSLHDFEFEVIRSELESLPYPYYAIPGNMDTGNKHAGVDGATGRRDIQLSMTSNQLDRFSHFFGPFPWSFVHKEVRFSGCYAAVAGSGLLHEEQLWQWLTDLASQPRAKFHVFVMHYALFLDQLDEPNWDLTRQDQYTAWYFSIDQPYRNRIFKALKAARVNLVLSGHIHCRRPVQIVEGIQFYKAAAIAMPQWKDRWTDGNPRLGFYRFWVTDDDITPTFIPLTKESTAGGAYGPGGHPTLVERDYSLAWEKN